MPPKKTYLSAICWAGKLTSTIAAFPPVRVADTSADKSFFRSNMWVQFCRQQIGQCEQRVKGKQQDLQPNNCRDIRSSSSTSRVSFILSVAITTPPYIPSKNPVMRFAVPVYSLDSCTRLGMTVHPADSAGIPRGRITRLTVFIGYFTTDFSFIDNVMHPCSWPHCNRRTINSFMMTMMMMMDVKQILKQRCILV